MKIIIFSNFRAIMEQEIEQGLSQRTGFSSEQFKIEVQNLPKFFSISQIKKLLTKKLELKPHKLKPCGPKARYMFINFASEAERDEAIAKLNGFNLKGNKLRAFKAQAAKDPMLKKAQNDAEIDTRPISEQIMSAVCPLGDKSYEDQIKAKTEIISETLQKLRTEFMKQNSYFKSHGIEENDLAILSDFVESPVKIGYRNKCEFSVGENQVGFRLASYRKGSVQVAEIHHLPVVSEVMKNVAKHFGEFVTKSNYQHFDNISQTGNWKQLTVRQSCEDLLVWAVLHPQNLSEDDKEKLKTDFAAHFQEFSPSVTSLNIQFFGQKQKGQPDPEVECIKGEKFIKEKLMGLTFKVSPQAFFQINTQAAEKLYSACGEIANLDKDTVLFDVCCGTGTIGLCLASKVKEVHGIDIVEEAVEDAKINAQNNGIENAHFHAGKIFQNSQFSFQKFQYEN